MRNDTLFSILALLLFSPSLAWADEPPSAHGRVATIALEPVDEAPAQTAEPRPDLIHRAATPAPVYRYRSPRMRVAGIVLTSIGLGAAATELALVGVGVAAARADPHSDAGLGVLPPIWALTGLAAIGLGVGIPLWAVGGKKVPLESPSAWRRPELMLSPRSVALRWTF